MKRSARSRATTSSFSASVHQQLNVYALAAGAAGVGILALSRSAEAKIVYTPANIHINGNVTYALKFNQKTDFLFLATGYVSTNAHGSSQLVALAQGRNGVEGTSGNASALSSGAVIGPKQRFSGKLLEHCTWADTYACRGDWAFLGGQPRYLGLKFYISGKVHYGWARLTLTYAENATISGYAYETIPNKAITAGKTKSQETVDGANQGTTAFSNLPVREPASLGSLAMGSSGLTIWRRKESVGD
jgi:hypothetical protein